MIYRSSKRSSYAPCLMGSHRGMQGEGVVNRRDAEVLCLKVAFKCAHGWGRTDFKMYQIQNGRCRAAEGMKTKAYAIYRRSGKR